MEVIQVLADPIVIVTDQVDSLGRESAYMVGELAEPDIVKKECDVTAESVAVMEMNEAMGSVKKVGERNNPESESEMVGKSKVWSAFKMHAKSATVSNISKLNTVQDKSRGLVGEKTKSEVLEQVREKKILKILNLDKVSSFSGKN